MSDVSTARSINRFLVRILKAYDLDHIKNKNGVISVGDEELVKLNFLKDIVYLTIRTPPAIFNNSVLEVLPEVLVDFYNYLKTLPLKFDLPVIWVTATGIKLDPVDWDWQLICLSSDLYIEGYIRDDVRLFNPFLRFLQKYKITLRIKGASWFCPYTLSVDLPHTLHPTAITHFSLDSVRSFQKAGYYNPTLNIPMKYMYPSKVDVVQELLDDSQMEYMYFKSYIPKYLVSTGHQQPEDVLKFMLLASQENMPIFDLEGVVFV